jgi:hypothetical protein
MGPTGPTGTGTVIEAGVGNPNFVSPPAVSYNPDDLWIDGSSGDLFRFSSTGPVWDHVGNLAGPAGAPSVDPSARITYVYDDNPAGPANYIYTFETPVYVGTGDGTLNSFSLGETVNEETLTLTALNSTTFSVVGSSSGAQVDATVGTPYSVDRWNFTLTAGSTPFQAGDEFTIVVNEDLNTAFNGKIRFTVGDDFYISTFDNGNVSVIPFLSDMLGTAGGAFKIYKVANPNIWATYTISAGGFGANHVIVFSDRVGGIDMRGMPPMLANGDLVVFEIIKTGLGNDGPTGPAGATGPTGPAPAIDVYTAVLVSGVNTTAYTGSGGRVFVNRLVDGGTLGASYSVVVTNGVSIQITAKDHLGVTQTGDTSTLSVLVV